MNGNHVSAARDGYTTSRLDGCQIAVERPAQVDELSVVGIFQAGFRDRLGLGFQHPVSHTNSLHLGFAVLRVLDASGKQNPCQEGAITP
jgi:hypothetical protein